MLNRIFFYVDANNAGQPFTHLSYNVIAVGYQITFQRQRKIFSRVSVRFRQYNPVFCLQKIFRAAAAVDCGLFQCYFQYFLIRHK